MDEYLVPTAFGEDEFYEKKSHFIGRAWPVETEEEALEKIQAMKKQHYDATHNCWAYIIKDGAVRFSDDGEPGGTAGMPMLQVLQHSWHNPSALYQPAMQAEPKALMLACTNTLEKLVMPCWMPAGRPMRKICISRSG